MKSFQYYVNCIQEMLIPLENWIILKKIHLVSILCSFTCLNTFWAKQFEIYAVKEKSIFLLLLLLTLLFFVFSRNNLTSWQQFLSAERIVHICDAFYIITLHFHREKQDSYWMISNMRDEYSWHLIRKLNSIEKVQSMEVVTRS